MDDWIEQTTMGISILQCETDPKTDDEVNIVLDAGLKSSLSLSPSPYCPGLSPSPSLSPSDLSPESESL